MEFYIDHWAFKSYIELEKSVGLTLNHVELVNAMYVDYRSNCVQDLV